jgi:hypothetical protein
MLDFVVSEIVILLSVTRRFSEVPEVLSAALAFSGKLKRSSGSRLQLKNHIQFR